MLGIVVSLTIVCVCVQCAWNMYDSELKWGSFPQLQVMFSAYLGINKINFNFFFISKLEKQLNILRALMGPYFWTIYHKLCHLSSQASRQNSTTYLRMYLHKIKLLNNFSAVTMLTFYIIFGLIFHHTGRPSTFKANQLDVGLKRRRQI